MSKYAKRCSSEVNENIFERIANCAADAWRARAVASSIRPRSNSSAARLLRLVAVSGCWGFLTIAPKTTIPDLLVNSRTKSYLRVLIDDVGVGEVEIDRRSTE